MSVQHEAPDKQPCGNAFAGVTLHDVAPQLRDMLADPDWSPACQDDARLRALLERLEQYPDCADEAPPPGVALLASAYADFRRFRRELSMHMGPAGNEAGHASPDEWLKWRLHQYAHEPIVERHYADYRLRVDRFHIA